LRAEHAFLRDIAQGRAAESRSVLQTIADAFIEAFHLVGGF
jgi:hypothetical protein